MKHSAGILIKLVLETGTNIKYLLIHPSNAKWEGTFSIPKGEYTLGEESPVVAALRETKEEVGIDITLSSIENVENPIIVNYINGSGKKYKEVKVYTVEVSYRQMCRYLKDKTLNIKKNLLQTEEVDWAGFMSKEDFLDKKLFWRFKFLFENEENNINGENT